MKLNRNCPHFQECELENIRLSEFWGYDCPKGLKTGKNKKFEECDTYITWERSNAVQHDSGITR